jgi:hypothetical protein
VLILAAVILPGSARAQTPEVDTSVEHLFGDHITFYALVHTDLRVVSATIFIKARSDSYTHLGTPVISKPDDDKSELFYVHLIPDYPMHAFSTVDYRYDITLEDGSTIKTPWYSFYYSDNRFEWQELVEGPFRIYWYEGELAFAQKVQDTAQEGLDKINSLLPLPIPNPLEIYIYPDARTMQTALSPASAGWVAGHADPKLGVIVVSLPGGPDQYLLMEQRIPHELMHIALHESNDLGYENIPVWLREGLASQVELYPNQDYRIMLEFAAAEDSLLPMENLCKSFPPDATNALLAYAQSASFTGYLHTTYGTSGLERLVTNYANGLDCDKGARAALGRSLSQLERGWRAELTNQNLALTAFNNLLPWLIILLFVLAAPLSLALFWSRGRRKENNSLDAVENASQ